MDSLKPTSSETSSGRFAYPVIDTNNGGTLAGTIEALGNDHRASPARHHHHPRSRHPLAREDVIAFRDMVLDVSARVSQLVGEGKSYEEVAAASPRQPYDDIWGSPERFLTALYQQLADTN